MKRLMYLLFAVTLCAGARMQPGEVAIANLPKAFANAMTKHDGHELAKIMASDVDFGARAIDEAVWLIAKAC